MGRGPCSYLPCWVYYLILLIAILVALLTWLIAPCAVWCILIGFIIGAIATLVMVIKYLKDRGPPMGDPRFRLRNGGTSKKPIKRVKAEAKRDGDNLDPVLDEVVDLMPGTMKVFTGWPPAQPTTEICVTLEVDGKLTEICHPDDDPAHEKLNAPEGIYDATVTLRLGIDKHVVTFEIYYVEAGVQMQREITKDLVE